MGSTSHILVAIVRLTYSAPIVAFYPLFIAWPGLGEPTVIVIGFLLAITPIFANTLSGIKNVDPGLVRAARTFGAKSARSLSKNCLARALADRQKWGADCRRTPAD
jgi:ABC-type nitrate/sulfonate/bicarbonate transport system permease component